MSWLKSVVEYRGYERIIPEEPGVPSSFGDIRVEVTVGMGKRGSRMEREGGPQRKRHLLSDFLSYL